MRSKKIIRELNHSAHKIDRIIGPFGLLESDDKFVAPEQPKPKRTGQSKFNHNKRKPKKVLTNLKRFARLELVNKAKRKGDKMATDNKKTTNKRNDRLEVLKSIAWLVEAAFRGFVGWVLLSHFDNYVTTAAALYALGTAGVIVVAHFVRAHK